MDYESVYKKIKKIIIYTGDVKSADPTLVTDCFTLRAEQAFLSHIDGEAAFLSIQGKLHSGILLSDDELMKLIILPLTVPGSEGKQKMLEKVVDFAEQIRRRINMTQLGQLYEKEKIEYANQKTRDKTREMAKSMLNEGIEIVKIMKITGLTEEELLRLQGEHATD